MAKTAKKGAQSAHLFEISGTQIRRKNNSCPKCGSGTFMAKHKDRETCGKCGYCVFKNV